MKKLLIALPIIIASFNVLAEDVKDNKHTMMEICGDLEVFARTVQKGRQEGVSLKSLVGVLGDESEPHINIAIDAYEITRYGTNIHKRIVINDFANDVYLNCLKDIKKGQ